MKLALRAERIRPERAILLSRWLVPLVPLERRRRLPEPAMHPSPTTTLMVEWQYLNSTTAVGCGDPFSGEEICHGFVVHYPVHSLDNGTRSLLGATNSCS